MTLLLVIALIINTVAIRWAVGLYELGKRDEKAVTRLFYSLIVIFLILFGLIFWSTSGR